jgi:hypothetical protein
VFLLSLTIQDLTEKQSKMKDDNTKSENSLLSYSVKLTLAVGVAIVVLSLLGVLFGNSIVVTWIFSLTWLILLFFTLRGFYLKWFK